MRAMLDSVVIHLYVLIHVTPPSQRITRCRTLSTDTWTQRQTKKPLREKYGVVHYWIRTVNGDKGFGGRVNHE